METVIDHAIEREIAAPPPRAARLPLSTNLLLWIATALFAVIIYGGARALLESVKMGWLGVSGRTVTARIYKIDAEPAAVKGAPPIQVGLHYVYKLPFGGSDSPRYGTARLGMDSEPQTDPLTGQAAAAQPPAPTFKVGGPLELRCATWFGKPMAYAWQSAPTGKIIFLTLCGGVVIAISILLLRRIYRWRERRIYLLRNGIATVGTVTHREVRAEDAPRYYITFGYDAAGVPREHEEQVSDEQWKRLHVGQPVSVLYDPDDPEDASLYIFLSKP